MKNITAISILLGLFPMSVFAQRSAPGYMGKRFLLKYDQGVSWSIGKSIKAVPNLFFTLQGDLAVTKKTSLGLEYSLRVRKYGTDLDKYGASSYNEHISGYYGKAIHRIETMLAHKAGFYGKLFSQRNGHIAPAGPYLIYGFHVHILNGRYYSYVPGIKQKVYPSVQTTFDVAPFVGGGKQYVVANRLVLDVSVRLSLPIRSLGDVYNIGVNAIDRAPTRNHMARLSNFEANLIEIRIGFGGLL